MVSDIQPQKSHLLFLDRFLSAFGSRLCSFRNDGLTQGQRLGTGRSILTNLTSSISGHHLGQ
jgi:hypothetical protein